MEICLLGDFSKNLDEGFKNTGHYLARGLVAAGDHVTCLNIKHLGQPAFWRADSFWRNLPGAQIDIIHAIAQPTHGSLLFTRLLGRYRAHARTVVSALRPESYFRNNRPGLVHKFLLGFACPDLVLVQSAASKNRFEALRCPVAHLPAGVDLERFSPAGPDQKRALRYKYGLAPDRPVILHVGHLRRARNLVSLEALPAADFQVLVVGSTYMQIDEELVDRLETAGIKIFKGYHSHIEEFYRLADCYVFPVVPGQSLSTPLSVLEAMACNLKVVTTPFSGLVDAFQESSDFSFVEIADPGTILTQVQAILAAKDSPSTRRIVAPFSWENITDILRNHYRGLIGQ